MNINLSSLEKALESLDRALIRSNANPEDTEIRDAVIQRFEYSFELCWKMLKRILERTAAVPSNVSKMSYKELIREGAEKGHIEDPKLWFVFRDQRNITSHTYDEKKAHEVWTTANEFYPKAILLLKRLNEKKDS